MKTIIAEKPSVAREIARIVGATQREEGYLTGNGYNVTWAFGHLVMPALPDGYGIKGFHRDNLPIIPPVFTLVPRQEKTDKGYKADSGVVAQIKIIAKLYRESERIIVATDAGREGELIHRYLYEYIGCATPFDRLWISSLTDKAIREGLENLKCGAEYDKLYYAAKARSEADWLVGINATQAITVAAGRGTYSLGRVQTPTLAMVCERFWENQRFVPEPVFQLHLSTDGVSEGEIVKFSSAEKWKEKITAQAAYEAVKVCETFTINSIERKETVQEAPLLYDLTTLQKEANTKHGFSAEQTLSIAQKLYEAKLITYPRTGSRHISEDLFEGIYHLITSLWGHSLFDKQAIALSNKELNRRSVDDTKITDHHALLPTGVKPKNLDEDDRTIYNMVVGRMLEAFSKKCIKDVTTVRATCGDVEFIIKGSIVKQAGWRVVYGDKEDGEDVTLPKWSEGDVLSVRGCSLTEGKTKPKPLHTEATLLSAMQTAGKEVEDEEFRQSLKECGIGTPATRASIIETLFKREYMVRQKKLLVPTEKGLALYSVVKAMRIADVAMTGEWEAALSKIESGEMSADTFRKGIEVYAKQITEELLTCDKLFSHKDSDCVCPKCQKGAMQFYEKVVRCSNPDCALPIFRQKAGKTLSNGDIRDLLNKGETGVIKGFNSKAGKAFSASVTFDGDFNTVFVFPETKSDKNSKRKRK
ncbi:DNA topoisomerase III [Mucinivorans hirudinis]|uniref:DNA topoisomerase n=1 Tax=Mucinivorans hirudinis TaxID=1433126 RepID=A0A060RA78_9BACT|nr:DNA topoisomerase III [Mucinivorans hirudinis]